MILIRLLSHLPLFLLYRFSDVLSLLLSRLIRYRAGVIDQNLAQAFPEKSLQERKQIRTRFYRHLTDVLVETLKTLSLSRENMLERVSLENPELIEKYYRQGQSVLVVTAHQGNWEWLLTACSARLPFHVDAVYMKLAHPFFEKLMQDIRGRFGAEPVEKRTAFRTIVRHTKQICITAMVADQHSHNPRQSLSADFFGKPANFYTGPERIARKLGQPMLFVAMKRRSRGFYSIRFHLVDEPPFCSDENAMIYRYINLIEQTVREQPEAYLWSHNRWKYKKKQVPETPA